MDVHGLDVVFSYARHGRLAQLKQWFTAGGDTDARDEHGNTPLLVGCQNGLKSVAMQRII